MVLNILSSCRREGHFLRALKNKVFLFYQRRNQIHWRQFGSFLSLWWRQSDVDKVMESFPGALGRKKRSRGQAARPLPPEQCTQTLHKEPFRNKRVEAPSIQNLTTATQWKHFKLQSFVNTNFTKHKSRKKTEWDV